MGLDRDHYPTNFLNQVDDLERRVSELERFPAGVTSEVGSMATHDLDGTYHTGQISDDQAPQFVMHDGSRSYTGDQSHGDHDISNVGSISLDSIEADAGTITILMDNAQAGALLIWDGVDTFLTLDTTVGEERIKVSQAMMLDATLYFGLGEDTNLYRSAADTLKTDDNLVVGDVLTIEATGTAPLIVSSSTVVTNLNADQVDGYDDADLARLAEAATITGLWTFDRDPPGCPLWERLSMRSMYWSTMSLAFSHSGK